jgi:6-phosphogluconolactonase
MVRKEDLIVFDSAQTMAEQFALQLVSELEKDEKIKYHLAVSGGKTPNLLFEVLASKYANSEIWQKVHFWWVDERMVAPNHPESNFGVVQGQLFSRVSIPESNIHRIKGENCASEEAESYSIQIQNALPKKNSLPCFDMILLGMGDDGHTASIFPNQIELITSNQICEVAIHPVSGQKRVTLTGEVINNALRKIFMVTGAEKAERLAEIMESKEPASKLPAFYIEEAVWMVDAAAARRVV